jgi:hypothetical protein
MGDPEQDFGSGLRMTSLVNRKYLEWTQGLDVHQSVISVFKNIRHIPYSLEVPITDLKTAPEQMLALGKGYCGPKHYLLAEMFCRLGYVVVYGTFPYLWNGPDLLYPPELRQLATVLPVAQRSLSYVASTRTQRLLIRTRQAR